jgi:hypothetical protein
MSEVEEVAVGGPTRWFHLLARVLSLALPSCATHRVPPLEAINRRVDLERFMGDWYVIGFIPITLRSKPRLRRREGEARAPKVGLSSLRPVN